MTDISKCSGDMKEHIHESNLIENIDDPKEDEQSLKAWEWLNEFLILTNEVILSTQQLIVRNQSDLTELEKGHYRSLTRVDVTVGGRLCPDFFEVPNLMREWLEDMKLDTALESHIKFEQIHPFVDGNGRTGRMLLWWQEIKEGKQPTLFKASERQAYYDLF